jgi:uncharacterized LabA/DUF88 family protein
MSNKVALLLDGGFVKKRLHADLHHFPTVADVVSLCTSIVAKPELKDTELFRIYYYDAPPFEGSAKNPIDKVTTNYAVTPQASQNKSLMDSIELQPNFAVRKGMLIHSGWQLNSNAIHRVAAACRAVPPNTAQQQLTASDLQANISQKGVDMRIGLDIASLALKRIVQIVVLVTGDSDFIPAMKFARREGLRVYLAPLGQKSILRELKAHADLVL